MWRLGLVGVVALGGCVTAATLDHDAFQHEKRAEWLALHSRGEEAARERDRAVADREEAKRRAESRGGYVQSELLLR